MRAASSTSRNSRSDSALTRLAHCGRASSREPESITAVGGYGFRACAEEAYPGMTALVPDAQRPLRGTPRHPAAGKGNVAAIVPLRCEESRHLAVARAVLDSEQLDVGLRRQ